jgi:hypothetical protein
MHKFVTCRDAKCNTGAGYPADRNSEHMLCSVMARLACTHDCSARAPSGRSLQVRGGCGREVLGACAVGQVARGDRQQRELRDPAHFQLKLQPRRQGELVGRVHPPLVCHLVGCVHACHVCATAGWLHAQVCRLPTTAVSALGACRFKRAPCHACARGT